MITRSVFLFLAFAMGVQPGALCAAEPDQAAPPPQVRLETSVGNIDIELYPRYAPITVANFLRLVDDGFYDGLIFHRVIANFMIQAGGFDAQMQAREPPSTIVNESPNGLLNRKQYVAMARQDDPDSAAAQFFINVRNNPHLDGARGQPGYTVFGKVIGGWDVVQEIELADTSIKNGMAAVPDAPIVILKARRL